MSNINSLPFSSSKVSVCACCVVCMNPEMPPPLSRLLELKLTSVCQAVCLPLKSSSSTTTTTRGNTPTFSHLILCSLTLCSLCIDEIPFGRVLCFEKIETHCAEWATESANYFSPILPRFILLSFLLPLFVFFAAVPPTASVPVTA